jgi:hypothetical protein
MPSDTAERGDVQAAVDKVIGASGEMAVALEDLLDHVGTLLDAHEERLNDLESFVGNRDDDA